jgi:glucosamine-6-phosphate deaminase
VILDVAPADRWAQEVADRLLARVRQQPELTLCLPTGATPRPVYARVAAAVAAGTASFARVRVFLLDEFGGLPRNDPARCTTMLAADLLDHVDVARVHAPDVDADDLDAACAAYEAAIAEAGGLDLALLGLGGNGHVGMNEPGASPGARTQVCELHPSTQTNAAGYGATTTPTWGVTMGLGTLLEADELWLLVTGKHKREVLGRAIDGPITPAVPASFLRRHERFRVLADDAAAGDRYQSPS